MTGYLDSIQRNIVAGWAIDVDEHTASLAISIKLKGKEIGGGVADLPRQDLVEAGHLSAVHGFAIYCSDLSAIEQLGDLVVEATNTARGLRAPLGITPQARSAVEKIVGLETEGSRRLSKIDSVVVVDIQDIMEFLKDHNGVTGIQRVVGGLVQAILRDDPTSQGGVFFCEIGHTQRSVRIFESAAVLALVEDAMAGDQPQVKLTAAVASLRQKAFDYDLKAKDVYFIAGAYWVVPDFAPRLNAMKQQGVVVGTYIYDLIPVTAPEWVTDGTRAAVTDRAIDIMFLSDFFLTISEFVAQEVRQLLRIEVGQEKPVVAVPLPHLLPPRRSKGKVEIRRSVRELPSFVLAVGTLEGRKNHMLLFRIWAALVRKHGTINVPILVLVGRWGWNIERFRESMEATNGLNGQIRILNDLGDEELAYLYEHCEFACFVSFVEGWGLPVGEALSVGKMCLCSNRTSIPEVGGDFCDYVDPYDYLSAFETFERTIFDREALAAKTKRVADEFVPRTWSGFAKTMVERIRTTGEVSKPLVPYIEARKLTRFTWNALVTDETLSWTKKTVKFARVVGWWELESWGVWAVSARPVLSFQTDFPDQVVTIMVELRLPPALGSEKTLKVSDGISPVSEIKVFDKSAWQRLEVRTAASGVVTLSFFANYRPFIEDHRDLFFGLSALIAANHAPEETDIVISLFEQLGYTGLGATGPGVVGDTRNAF